MGRDGGRTKERKGNTQHNAASHVTLSYSRKLLSSVNTPHKFAIKLFKCILTKFLPRSKMLIQVSIAGVPWFEHFRVQCYIGKELCKQAVPKQSSSYKALLQHIFTKLMFLLSHKSVGISYLILYTSLVSRSSLFPLFDHLEQYATDQKVEAKEGLKTSIQLY